MHTSILALLNHITDIRLRSHKLPHIVPDMGYKNIAEETLDLTSRFK